MKIAPAVFACLLAMPVHGGGADDILPRLAPGDVLTIRVASLPELDRDAMIGPDGAVRIAGAAVPLAGFDLNSAQEAVAAALVHALGAEPSFVVVDVLEWRPVTVYGARLRGGEVPWRPGMTVRRALAAASGRQDRDSEPQLSEQLELQRARARVLDETERLERAQVRVDLLEAELGVEPSASGNSRRGRPAGSGRIARIEADLLALRRMRLAQQRDNLHSQTKLVTRQLESLEEELDLQRRRVGVFEEQLETIETLASRGLSTQDRRSNRQADLMSAQLLVVRLLSEKAEAEARLILADSMIAELDTQWTLDLTDQLNDARATVVAAANARELAMRDAAASETAIGALPEDDGMTRLTIHRQTDGAVVPLGAEADTFVLPGDVIEVIRP